MNQTKKCCHCKQELPLSAFGKWAYGIDGLKNECKSCMHRYYHDNKFCQEKTKQSALKRYQLSKENPVLKKQIRDIAAKSMKKYYVKNKTKCLLNWRSLRDRKKRGITEMLWVRSSGQCENCRKLLLKQRGQYATHHKDKNKLNNTLDNLQLLCPFCHLHIVHHGKS